MADILEFKKPKPLKGFIPVEMKEHIRSFLGQPKFNLAEPIIDLREIDSGMPSDSPYGRPEKEPA